MRVAAVRERRASQGPDARRRPDARGVAIAMLALQRAAGNRAVARLVQRRASFADCEQGEPCSGEATGGGEIGDRRDHLHAPRFRGDEVLEACLQDRARLREGMNNRSVFKIQEALFELGYDVGRRGPDSVYGSRTAAAVRQFKTEEQLGYEQYGDVGPGTMHRLDEMFAERRHDDPDRRKRRGEFPRSQSKVEVLATGIGSVPHFKHLFIVHTDDDDKRHGFRAGPGNCLRGTPPEGGEAIMGDHGPYEPGFIDWDPNAESETALRGTAASGKDKCLLTNIRLIDQSCLDYHKTGPNSNTVAHWLLKRCDIPQVKPDVDTPGWNDELPI